MPKLEINIISQSQLFRKITVINEKVITIYEKDKTKIHLFSEIITKGSEINGLYYFKC